MKTLLIVSGLTFASFAACCFTLWLLRDPDHYGVQPPRHRTRQTEDES